MFTEANLRELLQMNVSQPVLSVYLNTEPTLGNADTHRLRLRNMLKEIKLPEDINAVERYFKHEYDWSGRGIAVFSCAAAGYFQTIPLAMPVPDLAHVGDRPSVKPLANLLENFGGYGVVLVDKQGARLFSFHLGQLEEQEGVIGETVKHVKTGGASSMPGRRGGVVGQKRTMDETVDRNIKDVVEFAQHFFESHHVRRILIGGSDDNVAQFRSQMPKSWQSLVVGSFPMSMSASHGEVYNKAIELGKQAEKEREIHLIENLITAAAKKAEAVVGLEDTLKAVSAGRVKTLVLIENLHKPGFRCPDCNSLTVIEKNPCDSCGKDGQPLEDVVEAAVATVIDGGGDVEIIHSNPSLEGKGSIGAFLRYK